MKVAETITPKDNDNLKTEAAKYLYIYVSWVRPNIFFVITHNFTHKSHVYSLGILADAQKYKHDYYYSTLLTDVSQLFAKRDHEELSGQNLDFLPHI